MERNVTIQVQINAYVIMQHAHSGVTIPGRFLGVDKKNHYVLSSPTGPPLFCDSDLWKCTHWHNQPKEADDSPAWIAARKQIARAMSIERGRRRALA